jgi:hypothetical protein
MKCTVLQGLAPLAPVLPVTTYLNYETIQEWFNPWSNRRRVSSAARKFVYVGRWDLHGIKEIVSRDECFFKAYDNK